MFEYDNAPHTYPDPPCPFCRIAASSPPHPLGIPPPISPSTDIHDPPQTHILLSTPHAIAFLDNAPLTRGHTLLITRQHRKKLSDLSVSEARSIGAWLTVLSRAVIETIDGEGTATNVGGASARPEIGDFNIVQNNGPRAAQVVPHVHFHIVPRGSDHSSSLVSSSVENAGPKSTSWVMFGRGPRDDLDDEEAFGLAESVRERLREEVERVGRVEGQGARRALLGGEDGGVKL